MLSWDCSHFSLSLEELTFFISAIQSGYLGKKLTQVGGRQNLPVIERRSRERVIWRKQRQSVGLLLPGYFPHKKDTVSSLEAWGNFLTLCPCMADFPPTPTSTNHQNHVNSVIYPFWLLCCNCRTQIIKGPKSRFLLLPPQSAHYFRGWKLHRAWLIIFRK